VSKLDGGYEIDPTTGCWLWTGAHGGRGYARVRFDGRTEGAHRVSFFLAHGYMPALVRHTCDVTLCVNPDHLLEGTKADNSRDMVERGRSTYGQRNPRAKLTDEQAAAIRDSIEQTKVLAERYGVCRATIKYIRAGTTWRGGQ
jgi:HNH endonuclease